MALALDRKAFIDILSNGKDDISGVMLPPPGGRLGHAARGCCRRCRAMPPTSRRAGPRRARSWRGSATAQAKPLKVKVSTRNIADLSRSRRDPHRPAQEDPHRWRAGGGRHQHLARQGDARGVCGRPEPDRRRRRRSRRQPLRELQLQLRAQPHQVLQQGGRRADRQAVAGARRRQAQADRLGDREASWPRTSRGRSSPISARPPAGSRT